MGRAQGGIRTGAAQRRATQRRQTRSAPGRWYDDDVLETALRDFTRGRGTWPSRREFAAANKTDLYCAAVAYGGVAYWAGRLGLSLTARQLAKMTYTHDEAVTDARLVVATLGYLPGSRRLRAMGLGRLATAVQSAGGAGRFAAHHQLL